MKFTKGMGFAALITMGSVLLSRVLGLGREALLAQRLGTGLEADAYAVAFMLPDLLNTLLAGGFLSISFLPLFVARGKESDAAAERFLSGVQILLGGCGLIGITLLWIFAGPAVTLLQPGLAGSPVLERAIHLSRILLPAQEAFLLAGAWSGAQYSRKHFLFPALAPLIYNIGIIAGGLFLAPWIGAEGFAWGVLAGAFLGNFAMQALGVHQCGIRWRLPTSAEIAYLRSFAWRTLPLMIGLTLGFSSEFLLRRMAGFLGRGAVAEANYGFRLTMVLVAFFGQAAGVASYPYLVELASSGRSKELNELIAGSLKSLLVFLIPACAVTSVLAPELVTFAFQRGHFGPEATAIVSHLLRIQVWCVLPWCVQIIFARALYARDRFWSSAVVGTLIVGISWPLWALMTRTMGQDGASGGLNLLVGLEALGYLIFWMKLYPGELPWRSVLARLPKPLLLTVAAALVARGLSVILPGSALLRLCIAGGAAGAFYLLAGLAWGLDELAPIANKLSRLLPARFSAKRR